MLYPKKFKYKKFRKGRFKGLSRSNVVFGSFGLKAVESGLVSSRQIEAARRVISRSIQRRGQIWIRIFPNIGVTQKPKFRMGHGKGSHSHWVARVPSGSILFEVECFDSGLEALKKASYRIPIRTVMVDKWGLAPSDGG